jgi:predicted nucleic acid-binding protein
MSAKPFIDSNILLYLNDEPDSYKKEKAKELVRLRPVISLQVVFECLNVCLRKLKMSKAESIQFAKNLLITCTVLPDERETGILGIEIFSKYNLQVYDSRIIASALDAGCNILYSEDMHNELIIENRLTIINPFL